MIRCKVCKDLLHASQFSTRKYKGKVVIAQPCAFCARMLRLSKTGPTVTTLGLLTKDNTKPRELVEADLRCRI